MEKSSNSIEKLFKQTFDDYSRDHNQAKMWSEIEAKLDKKRNPWPLYLITAFLFLSALVFWRPQNLVKANKPADLKMTIPQMNDVQPIAQKVPIKRQGNTSEAKDLEIRQLLGGDNERASFLNTIEERNSSADADILPSTDPVEDLLAQPNDRQTALKRMPWIQFNSMSGEESLPLTHIRRNKTCKIKTKRLFFFAELFGGGNYPFAETTSSPSTDYNDTYKEAWESQRSPLLGYQAGVMLGVNHSSGLSLAAGLMYQNTRYRLNHELNVRERIITTDPMTGEEVVAVREYTRKVQSGQNLETFTIPIRVGYRYNWHRWSAGLFVGTSLHLNQSFSGKYLDQNNMFVDAKDTNIYRENIGLSFWGGIEGAYRLNDHFELFSRLLYQHQGENRLVEQHPLELQIQNVAVEVGGRMHF